MVQILSNLMPTHKWRPIIRWLLSSHKKAKSKKKKKSINALNGDWPTNQGGCHEINKATYTELAPQKSAGFAVWD